MKEERNLPGMLGAARVGLGFIHGPPAPPLTTEGIQGEKRFPQAHGTKPGTKLLSWSRHWGTLSTFRQPQRARGGAPHSFQNARLLFQHKPQGVGEATGQKRGVEGSLDSQPKTRVPTCPRARGKSLLRCGPQSPHLYHEERELDKESPTQTPSGDS